MGVGLTLAALVLMGYPLTGASMNPARWFGPTLWELTTVGGDAFRDHSVYWIGPIFGALLAGAAYEYVLMPSAARPPEPETAPPSCPARKNERPAWPRTGPCSN